ncbi:M20/M25/M40 family metallo-hydrolase [Proteinivorax hydrogeniformans]|uniref:M20/M25/M40 family metallo-hydrolase n=1 Tax=Proteinivorax hydrogeniformans TaxID=1826727 RepID=A0AAU8HQC7_9FIRM
MEQNVVDLFRKLVEIDSPSFKESELANYLSVELEKLDFDVKLDKHEKTTNIIGKRSGSGSTILLSAHMDTVQSNKGVKIVEKNGKIRTDGKTILGADDKAGITAILSGIKKTISEGKKLHPLEVIFTYGEEIGLCGAKKVNSNDLKAQLGYVFDSGGDVGIAINKAPSEIDFHAKVLGKEAHSGVNPEDGVDAIKIAGRIISKLKLGRIDEDTSSNIGVIKGGEMTNIVCPLVELKGEVRSHNYEKAQQIINQFEQTFKDVCDQHGGTVEFAKEVIYHNFYLGEDQQVTQFLKEKLDKLGLSLKLKSRGGGSDANVFNNKGIPTLNLAVGMANVHTNDEYVSVDNLVKSSKLVAEIVKKEQ